MDDQIAGNRGHAVRNRPWAGGGPPSIGLALGGGGARGLAHILVLEVLDELGIKPRVIAGTSIGALFGAVYASGMPAVRIRAIAEETLGRRFELARQLFAARSDPVQKVLGLLPVRSSLLNAATLIDLMVPEIGQRAFADLAIPLKVIATDLARQETVVLEQGSLKSAIAASISIPLIFQPVSHEGRLLVDGGLVNPLPFDTIADMADITVAIDASGAAKEARSEGQPTAVEVLMQSVQIMQKTITRQKMLYQKPDIYIDVDLDRFGALEFWRVKEILAAAAPVKDALRRQLVRVLQSETVQPESATEPGGPLARTATRQRRRRRLPAGQ